MQKPTIEHVEAPAQEEPNQEVEPKTASEAVTEPAAEPVTENKVEEKENETKPAEAAESNPPASAALSKKREGKTGNKKPLQGPYRLFRLLPHAARPMLSKILEVDPQRRSTLAEMFDDEWFSSICECGLDENKKLYHGKGHIHTIVLEDDGKEIITDSTHFDN